MIHFGRHAALDLPSALVLRFQPPQQDEDSAGYLALFDRLARHDCLFVLYSDLRGFRLDHAGEVAQNQRAKASRIGTMERIRGMILVTDTPTERKRAAFANFWSIPVEVHDDPARADAAFRDLHERVFPRDRAVPRG